MKTTAKKKSAKKVATKKVDKTKVRIITRKNFPSGDPDKLVWGFTKEQLDKIAVVGIKEGYANLSQVIRAAMKKAFNI